MRYILLIVVIFFGKAQAQNLNTFLIGTYTNTGSYGIYVASFNEKDYSITINDSIAVENPSFLAFSPNKKYVYAVVENGKTKPGQVAAFRFDEQRKKLTFINEVSSGGDHPCHLMVHPSGKALAVANYNGGNFSIIQINKDGSLSNQIKTTQHYGSSIDTVRQKSPHVHQVTFSKNGNELYVTDLGTDKLSLYKIFDIKGTIDVADKAAEIISMQPGSGPRHIAISKIKNEIYVLNELKGSVSLYEKQENNFQLKQTVKCDTISKIPGSAQILITKDNKFIYVSNRAEANTIGVIKNKKSAASLMQSISTEGIKPRNFVLTPNEKFLLVANQVTNNIQVFKRNKNRALVFMSKGVSVPNPSCLLFY